MDDTVFWDLNNDLELHWWRVINFLEMTSVAGIMLNGDKFQFCNKEVDFAGFRITKSHGKPLPKYMDDIRHNDKLGGLSGGGGCRQRLP